MLTPTLGILPRLLCASLATLAAFSACTPQDSPPRDTQPSDTIAQIDPVPTDSISGAMGCSADSRAGIRVTVRDARTAAALGGYTVVLRTDSAGSRPVLDSVTVPDAGAWGGAQEQPGRYAVRVTKPGYQPWDSAGIVVTSDRCHVIPRHLDVQLVPAP